MHIRPILRLAAAVLALAACAPAHAQLFRAYLSVAGSDANPCTVASPCRLLPAALAAVADGGEIWMLDSANFNTAEVAVTKSVTILAVPGALGSLVGGPANAILVTTPGVRLALRNLVIRSSGTSLDGIRFVDGESLEVDGCEIIGMGDSGINVQAVADVRIRNTTIRDSPGTGLRISNGIVAVQGSRLISNQDGVRVQGPARLTIAASVITGSNTSFLIAAEGATADTTRVVVESSILSGGSVGAFAIAFATGSVVQMTVRDSHLTNFVGAAVESSQGPGTTAIVLVDGNVVVGNNTAFSLDSGTIASRGNNTLHFNTNDVTGGALTPAGGT